jgi:hypothetical protein
MLGRCGFSKSDSLLAINNRPIGAKDWPAGPVRGFLRFLNWRRPLPMHKYVQALPKDPRVALYLTADFRQRLAAIDSPRFGLVPNNARITLIERDGDEAFIKVNANDKNTVFVAVKENGRWLVDDIIETIPK